MDNHFATQRSDEDKLEDQCYEDACLEAAELVGPNSHEYDYLVESISERLYDERKAQSLPSKSTQ